MSNLADTATSTAAEHAMLEPGAPVLAMVSGGADSIALLRWLAGGGAAGSPVSALHVDHLMRGDASEGDAAFVSSLCTELGVPCRVVRYDVAAYAEESGLNLEDAGRRVRYRFADEETDALCAAAGVGPELGRIATAHTLDDRAETLVMRLAQGTGASGLLSPPYRRGRVIRPLLDCTRSDVVDYLGSLDQSWREDATNLDTARLRARVRADAIPLLRELNPRFDAALARTFAVLGEEDELLDGLAAAAEAVHVESGAGGLRIAAAAADLARPLLRRMVRRALFARFPEASRLEFEHLEAVCDGVGVSGFARDLPDRLRAFDEYGTLVISREAGTIAPLAPSLLSVPGTLDLGEAGRLTAEPAGPDAIDLDPASALIDASAVREGLVVDSVRPGDRMRPLGMDGSRKLQDVLTDAKVPVRQRPLVPVVRDGERIVWLAGVRMSDEYRVGPDTLRAIRLHWTPRTWKEALHVMHPDIESVIISEEQIDERVRELGAEISRDYAGETVLLVAVLRGAAIFLADLSRAITVPVELDFMAVSSYGSSTKSSGVVRILKDLDEQIEGRHVIVVEDILDTGLTLKYLLKNLASRKPASLEVVTLLNKEGKQRVPISCKYSGFSVPDEFVVGYGLDFAERYRNLPYVGVLKPSAYQD